MDQFTVGEIAQMLSVSADTVRRWVDQGRLEATRTPSGHRRVDGAELAKFLEEQSTPQEIPPISLASSRNRFAGIVTRVLRDTVMAQVDLQAGPFRIVSLMSREAADQLGLEPGVRAVAVIKATNVSVELPERGAGD